MLRLSVDGLTPALARTHISKSTAPIQPLALASVSSGVDAFEGLPVDRMTRNV